MLSVLDIFRIGIGPSSSHTVGPIRIGKRFVDSLLREGYFGAAARIEVVLQGSLALTGIGHATPKACILGLLGLEPETLDPDTADGLVARVETENVLLLGGRKEISFTASNDLIFDYETLSALHPNGMVLRAFDKSGALLREQTYYSTGGGFIASKQQLETPLEDDIVPGVSVPHPFGSADELLGICGAQGLEIHHVIYANEDAMRPREQTDAALDRIAEVMNACIDRGVTAPTNGAAGIIPSVLRHYCAGERKNEKNIRKFLLTAGGIGLLYKQRASISGAEMGCQGEKPSMPLALRCMRPRK